ncbi:MAG: hypothetical protein ABIJ86_13365, partial [Spirochaetota bacterium]
SRTVRSVSGAEGQIFLSMRGYFKVQMHFEIGSFMKYFGLSADFPYSRQLSFIKVLDSIAIN